VTTVILHHQIYRKKLLADKCYKWLFCFNHEHNQYNNLTNQRYIMIYGKKS